MSALRRVVLIALLAFVLAPVAPAAAEALDLELTTLKTPDTAFSDQRADFSVTVTNVGSATATGRTLRIRILAAALGDQDQIGIPGSCQFPTTVAQYYTITCAIPSLAPGATLKRDFFGEWKEGAATIDAWVLGETDGLYPNNIRETTFQVLGGYADVELTSLSVPTPYLSEANEGTIAATIRNNGRQPTRNQKIKITVPIEAFVDPFDIKTQGNCNSLIYADRLEMTCKPSVPLNPGQSVTRLLIGTFNVGGYEIEATTFGDLQDRVPSNNSAAAYFDVIETYADAQILGPPNSSPAYVGEPYTHTWTVRNNGPEPTDANVLEARFHTADLASDVIAAAPDCVRSVVGLKTVFKCPLGPMASGESRSRAFTVRLLRGTVFEGFVSNTKGHDHKTSDNSLARLIGIVERKADVRAVVQAPTTGNQGVPAAFTATITNAGPDSAPNANLLVELALDIGTVGVLPTACTRLRGGFYSCAFGTLVSGASRTVQFKVSPHPRVSGRSGPRPRRTPATPSPPTTRPRRTR